ncbi:hydroxyisourate hydrolase [Marinomonas sp. 15G1-11]|uniref:5-hydroxyisourate hydrolase n=1 Tax=Marinomonas phaeophyticola TaxID=3004091 RepID=A0ABT4JX70_9GAMM|nr:hydroxyisourate hydrolase [Marinomonas sp. 15G1-11]MCZ2723006.1 hydroxyisourate hydrolase [Marinomonas sp. 15G1-11]
MGYLTTHVLDTMSGTPASGIAITLFKIEDERKIKIAASMTNSDGRCDNPILPQAIFSIGKYELEFEIKDYFNAKGVKQEEPYFLENIIIRFGINDPNSHYHVPLLVSPYGYSTYRGS